MRKLLAVKEKINEAFLCKILIVSVIGEIDIKIILIWGRPFAGLHFVGNNFFFFAFSTRLGNALECMYRVIFF